MDNTIQTAKIAANQTIEKQAITANNLANVSTPGFKAQLQSLLKTISNPDETNKLILDSFQYDLSHGVIRHTEQPLDLALPENGWFVLRNDQFEDFYTRNGHFEVNEKGELNMKGLHVMGQNGTAVKIPVNSIPSFNNKGEFTTLVKDKNKSKEIILGRLRTVNILDNSYLYKHPNGFFKLKDDSASVCSQIVQNNKKIKLLQGALEESNVNPAENVINMINNTRQFDMQMKMISDCSDNEQKANSILNVNN
ncbi:Flagellar basal-body rod protein FlgF [Buchnera aphidicola (Eriosoma grossulariae)]|uniref:flagellar hook-basal body complex protein n=1 Tax=Buchnera aphidicola TaxID=9 RepID=UPI0034641F7D